MSKPASADEILVGFEKRNLRALSRLISMAENREEGVETILAKLFSQTGKAQVYGITGAPGAGKSTLVTHFVRHLRSQKRKVAVIAVDPVSPYTGGALLGDRIRLSEHFNDPDVFIRSLSTRGQLGGLSLATREVVHAVDAFGFDAILLETVGVGQSEVEVRKIADMTLVALVPEWGDGVQAIKAGILEIADLFTVHKSDREGAERVASELRQALSETPLKPSVFLTQENDPKSLESLFSAWENLFITQAARVAERREASRASTLKSLIEWRMVEQARAWVSENAASTANPYEGYLRFESARSKASV